MKQITDDSSGYCDERHSQQGTRTRFWETPRVRTPHHGSTGWETMNLTAQTGRDPRNPPEISALHNRTWESKVSKAEQTSSPVTEPAFGNCDCWSFLFPVLSKLSPPFCVCLCFNGLGSWLNLNTGFRLWWNSRPELDLWILPCVGPIWACWLWTERSIWRLWCQSFSSMAEQWSLPFPSLPFPSRSLPVDPWRGIQSGGGIRWHLCGSCHLQPSVGMSIICGIKNWSWQRATSKNDIFTSKNFSDCRIYHMYLQ